MTLPRAFFLAMAVAIVGVPLLIGGSRLWDRLTTPSVQPAAKTGAPAALAHQSHVLLDGVSVRDQITLAGVAKAKADGFRTLIDLRPDGEAPDQPPASAVAAAAGAAGLKFAYVPTPHGEIPATTVDAFARAMASAEKPVLLYCRSGSRAARVWALAEASRPGGADAAKIADSVRAAGLKIDDLQIQIATRVGQRSTANVSAGVK